MISHLKRAVELKEELSRLNNDARDITSQVTSLAEKGGIGAPVLGFYSSRKLVDAFNEIVPFGDALAYYAQPLIIGYTVHGKELD